MKKRFSEEQIIGMIKEQEAGLPTASCAASSKGQSHTDNQHKGNDLFHVLLLNTCLLLSTARIEREGPAVTPSQD